MGMNQYLYYVEKPCVHPNLRYEYKDKKLKDCLMFEDADFNANECYNELRDFAVPILVEEQEFDIEKMQKHFNLGANPIIYRFSNTEISIKGGNADINIPLNIANTEYTKINFAKYQVVKAKKIGYWSNALNISECMNDCLGDIEEGYLYQMDDDAIEELRCCDSYIASLNLPNYSSLFYCEK